MGPTEIAFERFRGEWIEEPIARLFERTAAAHPAKVAVDDGVLSITYAELQRIATHLARRIEAQVPAGRPVGVLLPKGALFPAAALACLAVGRPFVPIDLGYPAAHNQNVLEEAGLAAAIVDRSKDISLNIPRAAAQLDVAESLVSTDAPAISIAPSGGPALIVYTSGSTGKPKGICIDQRAILQRVEDGTNTEHLSSDDNFLLLNSPGTIIGIREIFAALLNGATLYVVDPLHVGIGGLLEVFREKRITNCYAVPPLWRSLLAAPTAKGALANLRILRTGGDNPLDSDLDLWRKVMPPSCRPLVAFGSTEIPTVFHWFIPPDWKADKSRLPVGYAQPGIGFMLLGDNGLPAAEGEVGELVVRSRYLALGLWQDGQLQPGPFTVDPNDPESRIVHTGDLVAIREDGLAEMVGRKDRQIKIRGLRVDPGQAEAVLRARNGVADVVAIPRRSGEEVSALIAYVVRSRSGSADLAKELKEVITAKLPRHMRPTEIHFLDSIPRLPSFKVDVKSLEQLDQKNRIAADSADKPRIDKVSWPVPKILTPVDFMGPTEIAFERFRDEWIEEPIARLFERTAAAHPAKVAVDDGVLSITYAELQRIATHLARRIEAQVPAGRPVGVLLPNGALFPAAALACLASGRPFVPIDLGYPAAHNQNVLEEAGLAAAIVDRSKDISLNIPAGVLQLDITESLDCIDAPEISIAPSRGPAIILYTSGSTGRPKGICNNQRAILHRIADATNTEHLHSEDNLLLLSSPGTIAGTREMFKALLNGATLHVVDPLRLGIGRLLEIFREKRITICYAVPALWRSLLAVPMATTALASLRVARAGGDNPLESDLDLFRKMLPPTCRLLVAFSSTEIPTIFHWFIPPGWKADKSRLPVGYAQPGICFTLLGDDGAPVGKGAAGELVVRSRYLALGLWQDGRLQPGPFRVDPNDPESRVLHTGDLVAIREDGLAEMVGRKDRQIKIRGLRVDPGQAEAILRSFAGVGDVVIIPRRHGGEAIALIAYVVRSRAASADLGRELKDALAAKLPRQMRPAEIHFIEEIPRLPSFKVDIKAIEQLDQQNRLAAEHEDRSGDQPADWQKLAAAPETSSVAALVQRAWVKKLGRDAFDKDIGWEEAGGDSLKAMEFWFEVERALGRRLPLDLFAENTRPSRLVAAIGALLTAPSHEAPAQDDADKPTLFVLPGIGGDDPRLVRFRAQFGKSLRCELIDYPDWHKMLDHGMDFDSLVDASVAQICAKPWGGGRILVGFSYGGFVAFAASQRLVESGHRVDALILLDSRLATIGNPPAKENLWQRMRGISRDPWRLLRSAEQQFIAFCFRRSWFTMLRIVSEFAMSFGSRSTFVYYFQLVTALRMRVLKMWRPTPLRVPTILLQSAESLSDLPADFGWSRLCDPIALIPIGGTHESMLDPPLLALTCAQILKWIAKADENRHESKDRLTLDA